MRILKITILAIALLAFTHAAYCEAPVVKTQVDNEIMPDTRGAIHEINNALFESMKAGKPDVMMNMFVAEGRADKTLEAGVKAAYEKLGELAKGTAFDMLHEYLIDAKGTGTVSVKLPGDGENNFLMNVEAGKGLLYISLLTSKGSFNDLILCFVYTKVGEVWQLHTFHLGLYKVAGKSAVGWYKDAKAMYDNGWDVPAMLWMQFVGSFLRPAPFIQYEKEAEMQDFMRAGGAQTARKYKFPFKVTWVKNMPTVYGLDTQFVQGRLLPVIVYITKYQLNRGVPIQEEADAINQKIETIIPGITKCAGEIVYRAFLEPPLDSAKEYKYRSVISKVKF